jgi:2',3'-cyclic-nucleotide 2'-phosphodiesterase (5'-nucleotidase family)
VEVGGYPLNLEKYYSVATKLYLATGGDGFHMLRNSKYLVDAIAGIDTLRLLLKFFHGADDIAEPVTKKNSNKSD